MREGYSLNQVLDIYVKNYHKITQIYKEVFNISKIEALDNHLILYFSEQVGLGFLAWENLEEMFNLAAKVRNELKKQLGLDISVERSLNYASKLLYSGADEEVIDLAINGVNVIKRMIETELPVEVIYLLEGTFLKESYINLEKIIYLISDIKNIEWLTPPLLRVYSIKDYLPGIRKGIERNHLKGYWHNEEIVFEIANRLRMANLSPGWWMMLLRRAVVLNKFVQTQLKTTLGIESLLLYLDSKWVEASQRLNLYELKPWHVGGLIGELKISKTEELLNRAFEHYIEERFE